jgi:hypothetical protein
MQVPKVNPEPYSRITIESKVDWDHVDKLKGPFAIARYLYDLGERGYVGSSHSCPLAGNGWRVYSTIRQKREQGRFVTVPLTKAEQEFVELFDKGFFPYLVCE